MDSKLTVIVIVKSEVSIIDSLQFGKLQLSTQVFQELMSKEYYRARMMIYWDTHA